MSDEHNNAISNEYILSEIFSYLHHRYDILNASLVCRAWRDFALPMLYQRIVMYENAGQTLRKLLYTLERNSKLCELITLFEIRAYPCDILAEERRRTAARLVYVLKHCQNLTEFVLISKFALTSAMRDTVFNLPHLRRLVINASEAIKLRPLDLWEIPFSVQDIGLVVSEKPFVDVLPEFLRRTRPAPPRERPDENALHSLSLFCGGSYYMTDSVLEEMFYDRVSSQLDYLRSLRIVGAKNLTADGIMRVIRHLHNLTSLSLEELGVDPARVMLFSRFLSPSLVSLRISHDAVGFDVNDTGFAVGIANVLCRCPSITSLVVYRKRPLYAESRRIGGKRVTYSNYPSLNCWEFFSLLAENEIAVREFGEDPSLREAILYHALSREEALRNSVLSNGIKPTEWFTTALNGLDIPLYSKLTKLYITGLTVPLAVLPIIHKTFPNLYDLALHFEHDLFDDNDGGVLLEYQEEREFTFDLLYSMLKPFSRLETLHLRFPGERVTFGHILEMAAAIDEPSRLVHIGSCNRLLKLYSEETKEELPPSEINSYAMKDYYINRGASMHASTELEVPFIVRKKPNGALIQHHLCEWDEAEWPELRHLLFT